METRARYVLVGLFTLVVIAAGFVFVYWLNNAGGLGKRTVYRVRFENSVSGLRPGSAVLFNGIRVGEVTNLQLGTDNPREVIATIAVEQTTPVRTDTQIGLEFQGLMGGASLSLKGGTRALPVPTALAPGETPVLVADAVAGQDTMQAAREVLQRMDTILAENSEALRSTMTNLSTFSGVLARNSDRVDTILEGLQRMTGTGTEKAPPVIYDLTAPRTFPPANKSPHGQLVVLDPSAVLALESQRIVVQPNTAENPTFADARWSDSLPKLFQSKIIQSFENANYLSAVARPMEGLTADYQLLIDIRRFQISVSPEPIAEVEFSAKILADGRITKTRIFHTTAPTKGMEAPAAVAALNEAFARAATGLVIWVSESI